VPIDNNVSEREMKRVVLNRKNSLFVGNATGYPQVFATRDLDGLDVAIFYRTEK